MNTLEANSKPALARGVRRQPDPVTGERVLLYAEGLLILSETADSILARCDGSASVSEIVEALASEYDASPLDLQPDVIECLQSLLERKLIVLKP